jgi:hypothetical protein
VADDIEVRTALRDATAGLNTTPDLLQRVRSGGRRRLARRRMGTGAAAVLLVAAFAGTLVYLDDPPRGDRSGATGYHNPRDPFAGPSPTATTPPEFFAGATKGELARDRTFLDAVRTAFARDMARYIDDLDISDDMPPGPSASRHPGGDPSAGGSPHPSAGGSVPSGPVVNNSPVPQGPPHIYWAGRTPAGRAAVVIQSTGANSGYFSVVSETAAGLKAQITGLGKRWPEDWGKIGALLGENEDVLLVVDPRRPVGWSTERRMADDGKIIRDYTPLRFTDGVAAVAVPAQKNGRTLDLAWLVDGLAGWPEVIGTSMRPQPGSQPEPTILGAATGRGCDSGGAHIIIGDGNGVGRIPMMTAEDRQHLAPWVDSIYPAQESPAMCGTTTGGRELRAYLIYGDGLPMRMVAVVGPADGEAKTAGVVLPEGAFPGVALRLPQDQGFLVLAPDAGLRWRAADGAWQDTERIIAIVPPEARQVETTVAGQPPRIIELR